jgi:hypothetical protein
MWRIPPLEIERIREPPDRDCVRPLCQTRRSCAGYFRTIGAGSVSQHHHTDHIRLSCFAAAASRHVWGAKPKDSRISAARESRDKSQMQTLSQTKKTVPLAGGSERLCPPGTHTANSHRHLSKSVRASRVRLIRLALSKVELRAMGRVALFAVFSATEAMQYAPYTHHSSPRPTPRSLTRLILRDAPIVDQSTTPARTRSTTPTRRPIGP